MPTDRHREKPLSLRLGDQRERLEHFARRRGQPVRRVIADAVRHWLDEHDKTTKTPVPGLRLRRLSSGRSTTCGRDLEQAGSSADKRLHGRAA